MIEGSATDESTRRQAGRSQIYGIDLLRFCAASLVVLYHLSFTIWAAPDRRATILNVRVYEPLGSWLSVGWVGVEIFFVISGFVIAFTANGRAPLRFIQSRLMRLVPGVFICATFTIPALVYFREPASVIWREYMGSLLFAPLGPWVAGPYWTLPVEVAFYLFIFVLLLIDKFQWVERSMYFLGGASTLLWIAFFTIPQNSRYHHLIYWLGHNRPPQIILLHHGVFFVLGVLAWLVRSQGATAARLFGILVFGAAGLGEITAQALATQAFMRQPVSPSLACAIWLAAMIFLAISLRFNASVERVLGAARGTARGLGLATYPLYLLHEPIGIALIFCGLGGGLWTWPLFGGVLTALLCLSLFVAVYLEPPVRAVGSYLFKGIGRFLAARWDRLGKPTTMVGRSQPDHATSLFPAGLNPDRQEPLLAAIPIELSSQTLGGSYAQDKA